MLEFLLLVGVAYAICRLLAYCCRCRDLLPRDSQRDKPQHPRSPVQRYEAHQPLRPPLPYDERVLGCSEYTISAVEDYDSLRARARQEANLMTRCYRQRRDAFKHSNRAAAKALLKQGKRHALKRDALNAKASTMIFKRNNQHRTACEVDLHGLYVQEAIAYSDEAVLEARRRGKSEIRLIVGQGIHSDGGIAKLKPAIQRHMKSQGFRVRVDPNNSGVLVVGLYE